MRSPALTASSTVSGSPDVARGSVLLGIITLAGAILRFLYLGRKSFWLDEGVSVEIARLHWSDFARILWRREANMAVYYLLLRGWLRLGGSESFVRALSVLFAVATLPVVYWLGKQVAGRHAGWFAAALLVVHAWHVRYAQEARSYSLYLLLTAVSSLLFLRMIEGEGRGRGYIAASVLAAYSHFFAVLATISQWASLRFFASGARDQFRRALQTIGVLLLPLLVFVAVRGMGPIAWITRPGLRDLHNFALFLTGNGSDLLALLYLLCCACSLWKPGVGQRAGIWFLLTWLLLPLTITLAFSLVRAAFLPRYLVMCVVPAVTLAGAGLARIRPRWMAAALLALMLALSLRGVLAYYRADFDLGREDWRACTRWILENSEPDDGVLFHSAQARMPFEYYARLRPVEGRPRVIFPANAADHLSYLDFVANTKNAPLAAIPAAYPRVWLVLAHNRVAGGKPDATTLNLESFLNTNYGTPAETSFAGIDVLLYAKAQGRH